MNSKNKKKWLSLITALVFLMQTSLPFLPEAEAVSSKAGQVVFNGMISYAGSTVGDFTVDGEQAFCGATRFSISQ